MNKLMTACDHQQNERTVQRNIEQRNQPENSSKTRKGSKYFNSNLRKDSIFVNKHRTPFLET